MRLTHEQRAAAIAAVADQDGDVAVDAVWQAARSPNHPLHDLFEWDLEEAAIAHWRVTARIIVRSIRVEIVVEDRGVVNVPRYVRDPEKRAREQGYALVERIADNEESALRFITNQVATIEGAIRRALTMAAVLGLEREFEAMMRRVARIRGRLRRDESDAA